jgi:hypothetical protein
MEKCFLPGLGLGPMSLAHLRCVSFGYGAHLTHRDNSNMMRLVSQPERRDRFGMLKVGEFERPSVARTRC